MAGEGLQWRDACYRDRTELASAACGSLTGSSNGQYVLQCSAPSVTGSTLTVNTVTCNAGLCGKTQALSFALQSCEPYDFEWWSPVLGAFFLALVSVLCVRIIVAKVFNRDSSV